MNEQTIYYDSVVRELKTDAIVSVYGAFGDKFALPVKVTALWDTGAYSSVISDRIARALGLIPINHTRVYGVNGWYESPVYIIDIMLPNRIKISGISVSRGELVATDMLIGMDIISMGDMLLVNKDKTTFTFRIPSKGNVPFELEEL